MKEYDFKNELTEWLQFFKECGVNEFDVSIERRCKEDLYSELVVQIDDCTKCDLHINRKNIVIGDGNLDSKVMFIGEAPGEEEDNKGLPFVGRAGQLLTKMLVSINLKREDVYIANIVKCRPPNNRVPLPLEVQKCYPYLDMQIDIIRPRLIVTLGAPATQTLLKTKQSISQMRGRFYKYEKNIRIFPTFHPAFLLRNPNKKREAWEDLKVISKFLSENE